MTLEQGVIATLLIAALAAGARGMWVFGFVYQAMVADRDFWRERALTATGLAEVATEVAEKRSVK